MMLNETTEKLAHIKVDALEAGRLYSVSSSSGDSETMSVFERTRSLFRLAMERQSFYCHIFKLLILFAVAVAHLVYLEAFLSSYQTIEEWTFSLHARLAPPPSDNSALNIGITTTPLTPLADEASNFVAALSTVAPPHSAIDPQQTRDLNMMINAQAALAEYKQNLWLTIAALCVALCTSSYFLFVLPITQTCRRRELLMGVLDLTSFAAVPLLLTTRITIVHRLVDSLADAMRAAHKLVSGERLMNVLQCTILPRERLAFCHDIVLSTIFPIILLKYLIILALLTLAYVAVAYLIEYCIRHHFPPGRVQRHSCCTTLRRAYCSCTRGSGVEMTSPKSGAYTIRPTSATHNSRAYLPVPMLSTTNSLTKPIIAAPLLPTIVATPTTDDHQHQ